MNTGEIQKITTWKMSPETEARFADCLEKLLAIANAVQKLHTLDDLEEPWECPTCAPANPTMFNAVRKELYQALVEWEELKNAT